MKYEHGKLHCEILKNQYIYKFSSKILYKIIQKSHSLNLLNITSYFNIKYLDKKYTRKKVINQNGFDCDTNICQKLVKQKTFNNFYKILKNNNIKLTQITGAIYSFSSSDPLYRKAIKNDKKISKKFLDIYNDLFGDNIKNYSKLEKLAEESKGDWFIPLLFLYGQKYRTNIVTASLNYDKVYVREALGYSRPITKKDIIIENLSDQKCLKNEFTSENVVRGDSYFKIVENGIFKNVMNKHNREIISGYSGSCVLIYNLIFNLLKILPKTEKNESLVLFMILADFYPLYHSISEILVTYTRDTKYLENYNLNQNELVYLKKPLKYLSIHEKNIKHTRKQHIKRKKIKKTKKIKNLIKKINTYIYTDKS